jgi:adhesin transport system outer membrane protein
MIASHGAYASTLEGEINGLLDSHPQIQAAKKSVQSSSEAIRAARAGYLPQVRVTGDAGPNFLSSQDRESTYGKHFMREGDSAGISVSQRLYDGNLTNSAVDAAGYAKDVSEATLRVTRQNTILEGVNAYLDVLRQNALVGLSRENERRLQTQLNLEDERVQRGSGMAVDVLSAKHRLQIAKERRVAYEGAQQQSLDRYLQVYGHTPDVAAAVEPKPPLELVPTSLSEAVKAAESENPNVDVAQRTITLTGERTRTAEAGYYPTVDLVGKSDYSSHMDGAIGMRRSWSMLVQANWDLFSGFRTDAQVAQASYDHAASKDNASQANRKATESVRLAWSQLATAKERLSLLDNAVNLANEVWEARKKMREAGKATVIDVLDAESDVTNAQINYVVASYDLRVAAYQLIHDMGRLEVDNLDRTPVKR